MVEQQTNDALEKTWKKTVWAQSWKHPDIQLEGKPQKTQ
jgi:hypothetical protein